MPTSGWMPFHRINTVVRCAKDRKWTVLSFSFPCIAHELKEYIRRNEDLEERDVEIFQGTNSTDWLHAGFSIFRGKQFLSLSFPQIDVVLIYEGSKIDLFHRPLVIILNSENQFKLLIQRESEPEEIKISQTGVIAISRFI